MYIIKNKLILYGNVAAQTNFSRQVYTLIPKLRKGTNLKTFKGQSVHLQINMPAVFLDKRGILAPYELGTSTLFSAQALRGRSNDTPS